MLMVFVPAAGFMQRPVLLVTFAMVFVWSSPGWSELILVFFIVAFVFSCRAYCMCV